MIKTSAIGPLKHPPFRVVWTAALLVQLAIWMQNSGAAWMMTELSSSRLMVSLVQTAMALPCFLLGLPSGVFADLFDKKRLLIMTQVGSFSVCILLLLFAAFDYLTAWPLLLLTFALGSFNALSMAAWLSSTIQLAPAGQLSAAFALSSISPNIGRVIGPALAGICIAFFGVTMLFSIVSLCFILVLLLLTKLKPVKKEGLLPPERLWTGMMNGLQYMRHSQQQRMALHYVFLFDLTGCVLWALLPLIAKEQLKLDANGYGLLLGCLGVGAIISATQLPNLLNRVPIRKLLVLSSLLYAAVMMIIPFIHNTTAVCCLLVVAGACWVGVNTSAGTVIQSTAAAWVRARVASIQLLVIMGAMALGAIIWGLVADNLSLSYTFIIAGVCLIIGVVIAGNHPLNLGSEADFSSVKTPNFQPVMLEIAMDDGPVAVEIDYRVSESEKEGFLEIARNVGTIRRRNGALKWRVYRDLSQPDHYTERFIVTSWAEYLRQRERATQADKVGALKLKLFQYSPEGDIQRFVAVL
ncbi:MAG: arabinose ABC transporter permease [Colwellia sp.]|nr:MAG: arabinose ABC transporter permease [Colwellia sp.]